MKSNIPAEVPSYLEQFIYQNEWDASPEWLKEAVLVGGNKNDIYILMKDGGKVCLFEEMLGAYKKCKDTDNPEKSEKLLHEFIISGPLNLLKSFSITYKQLCLKYQDHYETICFLVELANANDLRLHNLLLSSKIETTFEEICALPVHTLEKINTVLPKDQQQFDVETISIVSQYIKGDAEGDIPPESGAASEVDCSGNTTPDIEESF